MLVYLVPANEKELDCICSENKNRDWFFYLLKTILRYLKIQKLELTLVLIQSDIDVFIRAGVKRLLATKNTKTGTSGWLFLIQGAG
jgi:hypothetical protein